METNPNLDIFNAILNGGITVSILYLFLVGKIIPSSTLDKIVSIYEKRLSTLEEKSIVVLDSIANRLEDFSVMAEIAHAKIKDGRKNE